MVKNGKSFFGNIADTFKHPFTREPKQEVYGEAPTSIGLFAAVFWADTSITADFYGDIELSETKSASLYKVGGFHPVGEPVTSGSTGEWRLELPEHGFDQYIVKLGNLTSNRVTVAREDVTFPYDVFHFHGRNGEYDFELERSKYDAHIEIESINDAADRIAGLGVYLIEVGANHIVWKSGTTNRDTKETIPLDYFPAGVEKEYMLCIADWDPEVAEYNDLTGIKYLTDSVIVENEDYSG
jgi:hypothetical protein